MTTILPPGEQLHRALHWIGEQRSARPEEKVVVLVDEAALRFDLTPSESEWLWTMLRQKV